MVLHNLSPHDPEVFAVVVAISITTLVVLIIITLLCVCGEPNVGKPEQYNDLEGIEDTYEDLDNVTHNDTDKTALTPTAETVYEMPDEIQVNNNIPVTKQSKVVQPPPQKKANNTDKTALTQTSETVYEMPDEMQVNNNIPVTKQSKPVQPPSQKKAYDTDKTALTPTTETVYEMPDEIQVNNNIPFATQAKRVPPPPQKKAHTAKQHVDRRDVYQEVTIIKPPVPLPTGKTKNVNKKGLRGNDNPAFVLNEGKPSKQDGNRNDKGTFGRTKMAQQLALEFKGKREGIGIVPIVDEDDQKIYGDDSILPSDVKVSSPTAKHGTTLTWQKPNELSSKLPNSKPVVSTKGLKDRPIGIISKPKVPIPKEKGKEDKKEKLKVDILKRPPAPLPKPAIIPLKKSGAMTPGGKSGNQTAGASATLPANTSDSLGHGNAGTSEVKGKSLPHTLPMEGVTPSCNNANQQKKRPVPQIPTLTPGGDTYDELDEVKFQRKVQIHPKNTGRKEVTGKPLPSGQFSELQEKLAQRKLAMTSTPAGEEKQPLENGDEYEVLPDLPNAKNGGEKDQNVSDGEIYDDTVVTETNETQPKNKHGLSFFKKKLQGKKSPPRPELPGEVYDDVSSTQRKPDEVYDDISGTGNSPGEVYDDIGGTGYSPGEVYDDVSGAGTSPGEVYDDVSGTGNNPNEVYDDVGGTKSSSDEVYDDVESTQSSPHEIYDEISPPQNNSEVYDDITGAPSTAPSQIGLVGKVTKGRAGVSDKSRSPEGLPKRPVPPIPSEPSSIPPSSPNGDIYEAPDGDDTYDDACQPNSNKKYTATKNQTASLAEGEEVYEIIDEMNNKIAGDYQRNLSISSGEESDYDDTLPISSKQINMTNQGTRRDSKKKRRAVLLPSSSTKEGKVKNSDSESDHSDYEKIPNEPVNSGQLKSPDRLGKTNTDNLKPVATVKPIKRSTLPEDGEAEVYDDVQNNIKKFENIGK